MKNLGAVLTGGDFMALGAIRTLGRKGIPIAVLDDNLCISRYSRYLEKFFKAPKISEHERYIEFLIELAKNQGIRDWVLFPNCDEAVCLLSKNKNVLEEFYEVPTPNWKIIRNVHNKKNTYQVAEENKIPIPKTYTVKSIDDLLKLDLKYPVVLKPSIKENFYSKVKIKAFRINSKEELIKTFQYVCTIISPSEVLIQDLIPGGPRHLYSFCPFFKNGKIVASIMARRTRQHPMDFGHASTFAELVHIPELKILAEKFLKIIDYYGIGEVEFMHDPHDGKFKLLEVNPRIWGWHTLAIAAGVDLPYLLYLDAIGQKIEMTPALRDVKWVRLATDIPTVFTELIKGKMKFTDYLNSLRGKKEFAVLSADDPLPFFVELAMIPYLYWTRGF